MLCEVCPLFSTLTSTKTWRIKELLHGFQRGWVSHASLKDTREKNQLYNLHIILVNKVSWLLDCLQYGWKRTHINTSHTSSHTGRRKRKKIRASVNGRMQGDRQQTQTERESRMERANGKGQVLRDKQIAKDKAKSAGSAPLSWVTSPLTTSETSSESRAFDWNVQQQSLVSVTTG